jgi:quercetin dioxygenase-like cupin family protein
MRAPLFYAACVMVGLCATLALPEPLLAQTPAASGLQTAAPASTASSASELLRAALPDTPGKQLVVVSLRFPPGNSPKAPPHQHPGSVYVYVTKGEARLGVEGQPPRVVPAGQGFLEPVGSIHNVSESASPTEPATGIAFMIVPDGAPLVSLVPSAHAGH